MASIYNRKFLVNIGAECNLISDEVLQLILNEGRNIVVQKEHKMTINGVAGNAAVTGYIVAMIDLGQGSAMKMQFTSSQEYSQAGKYSWENRF